MRLGYMRSMDGFTPRSLASMRPRRMRLGYLLNGSKPVLLIFSFNEAEAHAPRIQHIIRIPGPAILKASMRPRRMRLGYRLFDQHAGD